MATPYQHHYGQLHLLVIGIDQYKEKPLQNCVPGAKAFIEQLCRHTPFKGRVKPVELYDEQAKKGDILAALQSLQTLRKDGSDRDEGVIIYVSGHGAVRPTRDNATIGYFAPHDYQRQKNDEIDWNTLIPFEAFTEARHFMAAKHVLFIFDCCYAGAALTRGSMQFQLMVGQHLMSPEDENKGNHRTLKDKLYENLIGYQAYQVLAAGNYNQQALDWWFRVNPPDDAQGYTSGSYSPFTNALIEGLAGGAANDFGLITADTLGLYARKHFENVGLLGHDNPDPDKRIDQLPRHGYLPGHDGGDFILCEDAKSQEFAEIVQTGKRVPVKRGDEGYDPSTAYQGLIVLVSPSSITEGELAGQDKTQWAGIEYHRRQGSQDETQFPLQSVRSNLKKLWLIHTQESHDIAYTMLQRYREEAQLKAVSVCSVTNPYSVTETCELVATIIGSSGLDPTRLIVDITGGTTPMSIGAARACQTRGARMQYCLPNHMAFAGGRANPTIRAMTPILLE